MMVVNSIGNLTADHLTHAFNHPFTASISIATSERHRRKVTVSDLTILVDNRRGYVDAVLSTSRFEIFRCARMPEAPAPEMHADPCQAVFVLHQINVVIPAADRSELRVCLRAVIEHVRREPRFGIIKETVFDSLVVCAADAE